jgi:WD40 repeat protein
MDETVRLWDVRSGVATGQLPPGSREAIVSLAFSPDGRTLASGDSGGPVRLWEGILWHDFSELRAMVCDLVVGNLTKSEWAELLPGIVYRTTCPA